MLKGLGAHVRGLLRRETIADEVDEELQFHLEMETRTNVERGMTPREARRAALRDLGGVTQTSEAVADVRATVIDTAWQYLRSALRALRHNPGYTLVVTLVLAIGIAGSTFVYSVAEALLFRPIPYSDPESLYLVSMAYSTGGTQASVSSQVLHWEMFDLLRERHGFLENVSAYASRGANILGHGWSERLQVGAVTGDFLPLTGVRPSRGRGFLAAEFQPGHNTVALLTHSLWQRRFGGTPDAIGRTIDIDDAPYTVVGVLPADFKSIDELETGAPTLADNGLGVLVPLAGNPTLRSRSSSSGTTAVRILGRLRRPRMLEAARDEVRFLGRGLSWPSGPVTPSYTLTPLVTALSQGVPERVALLAAAVAVLLLVACANAALLMLERGESRRRELEIRAALGATAARLAGEGFVEAGLLGASAGLLGLAVAWGAVGVMGRVGGAALTGVASARLGWPVVGFALAVSLGTALLAGLLPCARLLQADVARWLPTRGSPRPPSLPGSLPSSIVVAQVGLSVGLIVVGGMLARDFSRLAAVDVGYETKGVLSAEVALSPVRHPDGGRQFLGSLLERLRGVPGVQAAALVQPVPGALLVGGISARVEGFGDEPLEYRVVSASFFSLLRIPILAGRSFTDAEVTRAEPVVVVTNAFAEKYWGSARAALGRHIGIGQTSAGETGPPVTVVGVSRDFRDAYMRFPPEMYMTYTRAARGHPLPEMSLLVRGAEGDLPSLRARLASVVREVDPYQPLYNVRALDDLVKVALVRTRLLLVLVTVFSTLTTLLAAVGIYVVLAFAVTRRTQELGIRLALGATRRNVLRLVLGRTIALVARGVVVTVPLTFCAIWLFAAQLFGVTDTDPITCVWAVGVIVAAAVVASIVPAWRATRIDPTVALRQG